MGRWEGSAAWPAIIRHPLYGVGLVWARSWAARHVTFKWGDIRVDEFSDWSSGELLFEAFSLWKEIEALSVSQYGDTMNEWLKKAAAQGRAQAAGHEVEDEAFAKSFPALYAFLVETTGEGGQARELCRVTVFADRGRWKASLVDPGTEHSLFVTLDRPQDAFKALDKALASESPDWRAWGGRKAKGRAK